MSLPANPIGIGWEGAPYHFDDAEVEVGALVGGFGPLVLGDYPNALTTPEESLAGMFGDSDMRSRAVFRVAGPLVAAPFDADMVRISGWYLDDRPIEIMSDGTFTFLDEDDAAASRIHAARGDVDSIDIFGDTGPSLWQRLTSRWGRFKDWLNGPVPGDDGATISSNYYPWGML